MITPWGMMFDPLADKFLIIPCLIVLMFSQVQSRSCGGDHRSWGASSFFLHSSGGGRTPHQANVWGKIKMFLQVMGVVILLLAARLDSSLLSSIAAGILVGSIAFQHYEYFWIMGYDPPFFLSPVLRCCAQMIGIDWGTSRIFCPLQLPPERDAGRIHCAIELSGRNR